MRLSVEEQKMLDGVYGRPVQKSMELLVALGECYDADRMVSVSSVHMGCSTFGAGKGGTKFIQEMADKGGKFKVVATTNAATVDPFAWKELGFDEATYLEQMALFKTIARMGGYLCASCTPYQIGHVPRMGSHVAWMESSAIIYANSVLGARSNREGGPSALAAALTGRTPAYGYHLTENRYARVKVVVKAGLKGDTDYSTLGYFTGRIAQDRIPMFVGINPLISQHELKCLGAAIACAGSAGLYHAVGITPEAPTEEAATGPVKIGDADVLEFGEKELKETARSISKAGPDEVSLVILGCPHASMEQLVNYAHTLSGRKLKDSVDVWILVSHSTKTYADDLGYGPIIESSGAKLVSNTCPSPMPTGFFHKLGHKVVATDAAKMVYYASSRQQVRCHYGALNEFIDVISTRA